MKNLKKVLALGLALVMVLGMFTMVSAADEETETTPVVSDLSDWEDVENKDAVALNYDLEIIKGRSDGSFGASDPIRRDEWAKMVYVAMVGDDDASYYVGEGAAFTDMEENWAKGYVNYLSDLNVVSGFAGLYSPEANITVAQAVKTMLTALGYDADKEGLVNNDSWATRAMNSGKKLGLLDGISQKQDDKITKDNAAQMVYNCLFCQMVDPEYDRDMGEWYVKSYNYGETLGYEVFNLIKVQAVVASLKDGNAVLSDVYLMGTDTQSENVTVSGLDVIGKMPTNADQVGQNVVFFAKGTITRNKDTKAIETIKLASVISNEMVATGSNIIKDTYDGIDFDVCFTKATTNKKFIAEKDTTVAVYIDSNDATGKTIDDAKADAKKAGNRVQLIDNDNNKKVDTIKVTTYSVDVATGDAEVTTNKDGDEFVKIPGVIDPKMSTDVVVGYEDVEEDDVLLICKIDTITYIEKAEIVSGKITRRTNAGKITVNGSTYVATELGGGNIAAAADLLRLTMDTEYDFYLDKAGKVCYAVEVEEASESKEAYALMVATGYKTTGNGTEVDGSSSTEYQAKVVYVDGTTEVLTDVVKYGGKTLGAKTDGVSAETWAGTAKDTAPLLVKVTSTSKGSEITNITMTAGVTKKEISAAPVYAEGVTAATTSTIFFIQTVKTDSDGEKTYSYKAVTGYKSLPSLKEASTQTATDSTKNFVFITSDGTAAGEKASATDFVYIVEYDVCTEDVDGNYTYDVINADGEEDTIVVDSTAKAQITANGLKLIETKDGDVITAFATGSFTFVEATVVDDEVMKIGKTFLVDKATKCVLIYVDEDNNTVGTAFSPATLDDGYNYTGYVVGVTNDNDTADFVIVIRGAEKA